MALSPIQNNFTQGEISPRVYGRFDLSKYFNGCKQLVNMIVYPHGGATRRVGTRYVADAHTTVGACRLIPFEFSELDSYVLEFTDELMRVFREGAIVTTGPSPYTEVSPYDESDLEAIKFVQTADVIYMTNVYYPVTKLTRTAHNNWTFTDEDFYDGPYRDVNTDLTNYFTASVGGSPGATITVTSTNNTFAPTDVGRWIRIGAINTTTQNLEYGWGTISAYNNEKSVNVLVEQPFFNGASGLASNIWRLGAFSSTTSYPASVALYQQRILYGGTLNDPQTIWGSKQNDFAAFSPTEADGTVTDAEGFSYTIASGDINTIRWLISGRVVIAGTKGSEFSFRGGGLDTALSANSVYTARESSYGVGNPQGIVVESSYLYTQRAGRKFMEMVYDFNVNGYDSEEISLLSEHIFGSPIKEFAFQQTPDNIIWFITQAGDLVGLTYNKSQNVYAFHRHELGGTVTSIESIAVIPSTDQTQDQLWMVVNRTVNGVGKRYIEILDTEFNGTKEDSYFLDCGITYDGAPATIIPGLDHLIGETVQVLADGATHPDCVVDGSGQITLNSAASKVHVGYNYTSTVQPVSFDFNGDFGGTLGRTSRTHKVYVKLHQSLGCKIGPNESELEQVLFRTNADLMGQSPALFTGVKFVQYPHGYEFDRSPLIIQDQPLPLTVLAVSSHMNLYEV